MKSDLLFSFRHYGQSGCNKVSLTGNIVPSPVKHGLHEGQSRRPSSRGPWELRWQRTACGAWAERTQPSGSSGRHKPGHRAVQPPKGCTSLFISGECKCIRQKIPSGETWGSTLISLHILLLWVPGLQSQQGGDATLAHSPWAAEVIQSLDGSNCYIEKWHLGDIFKIAEE